nr:MAG TPA: hypothetical protein [Caudoviricetes sp.]
MTDTVRKAADILYQRSGVEGHAAWTACQEHAQALHDAGLLAPDLPEPTFSFSDGTKAWFVEDDEEGYCIGATYIFNGEILLHTAAERVKGAPSQMRKIALALLAAANHAQEEA